MAGNTGTLRLGSKLDDVTRTATGTALEVAPHSLTTHGVIVGMTGSGKTGLGIVLLEEVLRSGIPALILDPKGDMGNLALRFPELRGEDFEPWVDEGEARREGISPGELGTRTAELWRKGLERSGLGASDLARFRDSVDVQILTPGSTAGTPLNVLGDLSAPKVSWDEDAETLRGEIDGLVSGILALAGLESDPLTSREHILLANLVEHAWREGRDLDLATLLGQIQNPPMRRLGVFELDAFFPAKDRTALAMRLNGLVASPSFAEWLRGAPLDVESLLRSPDGRTRASIVYMAHLSEQERQFVVTLLLSKVVTWMRQQPGTSQLRALVYVDEMFGLAPPTGEPPSKKPFLTLFKQARAHGLGMVIATQNPVDVDYKLMSNAGTWMVGRLQTERDKARILEALRSASGDVDVGEWDARIGSLGKREFILKSAASSQPSLFTTRWAMSYLRGPLTRTELIRLRSGGGGTPAGAPFPAGTSSPAAAHTAAARAAHGPDESPVLPAVSPEARTRYLDAGAPWAREVGAVSAAARLEAGLAMRVSLLFDEDKADLRHEEEWEAVIFPLPATPRGADAVSVDYDDRDFREEPPQGATYVIPEAPLKDAAFFRGMKKELEDHLFRSRTLDLMRNPSLKLHSRVGETEEAFRRRCMELAEDQADAEAATLRVRFEKKLETVRDRKAQAERRIRELEVDVGARKQQEMVAGAGEILSLFLGGRSRVRSLSGAASRRSQVRRTQERLQSAQEKMEDHDEEARRIEDELADAVAGLWERWRSAAEAVEPFPVTLEKNDIRVEEITVFWAARAG